MEETINAKATRDFRDAGTETNYEADKTYALPAGVFQNYLAAGLVTAVTGKADPKSAAPDKPTPSA